MRSYVYFSESMLGILVHVHSAFQRLKKRKSSAPPKTNMEPENHPIEKENHLPFLASMFLFRGVTPSHCVKEVSKHWFTNWWHPSFQLLPGHPVATAVGRNHPPRHPNQTSMSHIWKPPRKPWKRTSKILIPWNPGCSYKNHGRFHNSHGPTV